MPLSMAASLERRRAISALTFLRSIRMRVAPGAVVRAFRGRRRPSAPIKAIGPGKPIPGPMTTNDLPEGRGEGRH
jgi:hypothetical protein